VPQSPDEYHRRIGIVAATMTKSSEYCHYPIASLSVWIEPAILLDQIHFLRDRGNNVVGYVTWALLAEDTENRLMHDPEVIFHLSEWNEGDRLWIMDMVLLDGRIKPFLEEVRGLFPAFNEAKSLRRRDDGSIRKVTTWRR
jgi:hemolysin-activating ACP:hemolysin acyltransferase